MADVTLHRETRRSKHRVFDISDLRDVNEKRFLHLIRMRQPISRADLVKLTGVTAGTVSAVVGRLITRGFVVEGQAGMSSGGRRPVNLRVNADRAYAVGFSIGVRNTECVLSDFNGRFVSELSVRTGSDAEPFLRNVARTFLAQIEKKFPRTSIQAAAASIPGLLDREGGRLVVSPNLGWSDVPVRAILQSELSVPVQVENDANASALSEFWYGPPSTDSIHNLIFVLVVEGVGTGIILNGALYSGSEIGLGGFGHMPMDPAGPPCSCGNVGCWETLASDTATLRRYNDSTQHNGLPATSVSDVVLLAQQGSEHARKVLLETARHLGRGIRGLAQGLAPEAIVIGGAITAAWDMVAPEVQREIHSGYLIPGSSMPEVRPASASRSSLFGAIPLAFDLIEAN